MGRFSMSMVGGLWNKSEPRRSVPGIPAKIIAIIDRNIGGSAPSVRPPFTVMTGSKGEQTRANVVDLANHPKASSG
jgi:hypothetical protein